MTNNKNNHFFIRPLFVLLVILCVLLSACASSKPYFINRGRDVADVFTATGGFGLGAKIRIGPINPGIFYNARLAGLQCGELFTESFHSPDGGYEFINPIWGMDFSLVTKNKRNKEYKAAYGYFLAFPIEKTKYNPSYFTQIEIGLGLGLSLGLGFNPGEFLDFIIGWTTIDIYDDDIENNVKDNLEVKEKIHIKQMQPTGSAGS